MGLQVCSEPDQIREPKGEMNVEIERRMNSDWCVDLKNGVLLVLDLCDAREGELGLVSVCGGGVERVLLGVKLTLSASTPSISSNPGSLRLAPSHP